MSPREWCVGAGEKAVEKDAVQVLPRRCGKLRQEPGDVLKRLRRRVACQPWEVMSCPHRREEAGKDPSTGPVSP